MQGIQVRRTIARGLVLAKPAMMITMPATGDTGRIISLASCIIMARSTGSPPRPAATDGAIGTSPVKDATPEPVRSVTRAITAETTKPVPDMPKPRDFAPSMRSATSPVFLRPSANRAATKIRPTTFVSMLPMPLNIA